jgi:hypothetical protein
MRMGTLEQFLRPSKARLLVLVPGFGGSRFSNAIDASKVAALQGSNIPRCPLTISNFGVLGRATLSRLQLSVLGLYPAAFSKFRSLNKYSLSFTDSPKKIPFSISPTLQQRCLNLVLYILPSSKSHLSLKPRPSASVLRRRKQWIQKGERDATFSSTGGHPLK